MNIVEMHDICKHFGDVVANDHVHFELRKGEIHALLGENGAGKTTIMRILYGLYREDSGKILIDGMTRKIQSPRDAINFGIGMVTQHFTLVPTLSVTENINLGYGKRFSLNYKKMRNDVIKSSEKFGIQVNPDVLVNSLSVGEKQRVEILKALHKNAKVLILDEPTAVLVPQEVDLLFESLRKLKDTGLSVVFISHKLNEVMNVCDRVTVLRSGRAIGTVNVSQTTKSALARMMVGRETYDVTTIRTPITGKTLLSVSNLKYKSNEGLEILKGISFEIKSGEILGLAGVSGNGQTELAAILSGILKPESGNVVVDGDKVDDFNAKGVMNLGISRIPEDRHNGIVNELTVAENLILENPELYSKNGKLDKNHILEHSKKLISEYQIKASSKDIARTLSGGNIQKVILARTLSQNPKIVIAAQPTRGLDVGATEFVRKKILEQKEAGAAVLLISEDLDEILALSDRIAVIFEGRLHKIDHEENSNIEKIGLMMSGSI